MNSSILRALAAACVAGLLFAGPAIAEPEATAEGEVSAEDVDPDESFAKGLLGKAYEGDLELEGWTNFGGGLVSPPIYVNLYQREDGTSLVVTSKLSNRNYVVTDALIISKPWKGYAISIGCMQGDDFMLRFVGDARGPEESEWWTEVRRAWEVAIPQAEVQADGEPELQSEPEAEAKPEPEADPEPKPEPGKITTANAKGVKCTNPNW